MKLKAEQVQGGYVLNGTKFWITNATYADTLVVYAKTGEGSRGITTFLIEKGMTGFSIGQKLDKMGMRGSPDRRAGVRRLRGAGRECDGAGQWRRRRADVGARLRADRARRHPARASCRPASTSSCPMSASASSSAKPIGSFQLMQAKVADMYVALNSARAYVYQVARACDAGKTTRFDAAGAILLASENAVRVAGEAIQALGGAGYTKDWPVERYFRDAKLLDIGAGTNEIRRMLIGRELIGA